MIMEFCDKTMPVANNHFYSERGWYFRTLNMIQIWMYCEVNSFHFYIQIHGFVTKKVTNVFENLMP